MLVLSRKVGEEIVIDGEIRVTVLAIRGNQVRIGFQKPHPTCLFIARSSWPRPSYRPRHRTPVFP